MIRYKFLIFLYFLGLICFSCFIIYSQTGSNKVVGFESPVFIPSTPTSVGLIYESPKTPTPSTPDILVSTDTPSYSQISSSDVANGLVWLEIPTIGVNSRLDLATEIDSAKGPTFTQPSENPLLIPDWSVEIGLPGVSMIYGHRQWGPHPKVFTDLDKLIVGDQASVKTPQHQFIYSVSEILVINPDDLWTTAFNHDLVAKSNNRNYLMLITCTPWGTDFQRLIIFLQLEAVT